MSAEIKVQSKKIEYLKEEENRQNTDFKQIITNLDNICNNQAFNLSCSRIFEEKISSLYFVDDKYIAINRRVNNKSYLSYIDKERLFTVETFKAFDQKRNFELLTAFTQNKGYKIFGLLGGEKAALMTISKE